MASTLNRVIVINLASKLRHLDLIGNIAKKIVTVAYTALLSRDHNKD